MPNDDGQGEAEADDLLLVVGAEGSDTSDGQLVDRGHLLVALVLLLSLLGRLVYCPCVNFEGAILKGGG